MQLVVEQPDNRIDRFLAGVLPGYSRAQVRALLKEGRVRVNGQRVSTGVRLNVGDEVSVDVAEVAASELPLAAFELPLTVLFEGEDYLVLDKPAGMPTLPLRPSERSTLANALVARYPEVRGVGAGPLDAGLLHRLDNDTSGLLLAARTAEAYRYLQAQQAQGAIAKTYLALVQGQPPQQGEISLPIAPTGRRKQAVRVLDANAEGARPAHTTFVVQRRFCEHALVEAHLRRGARHQLRAHLAAIGHPIAGDLLYGGKPGPVPRHFLHAWRITLRPSPKQALVTFEAPLPAELISWLEDLDATRG